MDNTAFPKLTIIELAGVLAGPAVGMFFAELGATVIKVENPNNPDVTRNWKLPTEDSESPISAYFSSVNYNKTYIQCDLKNHQDLNNLYDIISTADIIITNFKDDKALSVDYKTLSSLNPKLIYASITGYGQNSSRPAFDVVLQAETGFMSMNGNIDSGPIKMPVALIDILTAHQLKEAILLALLKRERTGLGSFVTVSLYESAIASLANQATSWLMAQHIAKPIGSLHPSIAPYGETFTTLDNKQIVLAIGNNLQFSKLISTLGLSTISNDQRFINNQQRVIHRKELALMLKDIFKTRNADDWMFNFSQENIPAGIIANMSEVFENELANEMILNETIDGQTTKRVSSISFSTDFLELGEDQPCLKI